VARTRRLASYGVLAVLTVTTAAAIGLLALRVPHWQSSIASMKDPKDRITLENEVFKNIIQLLGGAFFLFGLYFTWRNLRISQEGQITQRFNDAIEHLGSEKAEIRLGGIYALARIARDSPKDHMSVMHVFCSYLRESTKRSPAEPAALEVQAILTMIGRRTVEHENEEDTLDLRDIYVPGVDLRGAQLERVRLDGANLSRASLANALLRGASLRAAVLEDADLRGADLREADLTGTDLRQATLRTAWLDGANLFAARLDGTTLLRTDLSGVKNAVRGQIAAAITDESTIQPVYADFAIQD
jgi:hypothetical protein